jgi:hypothetical protein
MTFIYLSYSGTRLIIIQPPHAAFRGVDDVARFDFCPTISFPSKNKRQHIEY